MMEPPPAPGEEAYDSDADSAKWGDLGDDSDTAAKMTAAAARRRGGYCRAIMVNPLMRGLPKLAIMLQVT